MRKLHLIIVLVLVGLVVGLIVFTTITLARFRHSIPASPLATAALPVVN